MASAAGVLYDVGSWRLGDDGHIFRRGRLKYANGDLYDGEWVDGKRHGHGVLTFADGGGSYVGGFASDMFHGFGVLEQHHVIVRRPMEPPSLVSGALRLHVKRRSELYEGDFRMGKRHGRGSLRAAHGDVYDGQFVDDYYHGRGVCAYPNGDVYDGEWRHGRWHGQGELRRGRDGSSYLGEFCNGLFHGFGRETFGRGGSQGSYTGGFRFGQRHGHGQRVWRLEPGREKTYDGDWRDDEMHGIGVVELPNAFKYVGELQHGQFHGQGVISYTNGDSYEGEFARGALHGSGTFTFSDGGWYVGQFADGKRHGRGRREFAVAGETYRSPSKLKSVAIAYEVVAAAYDGDWVEDEMHGRGELTRTLRVASTRCKRGGKGPGGSAVYRYSGPFERGQQTGNDAVITFRFTPAEDDGHASNQDAEEIPAPSRSKRQQREELEAARTRTFEWNYEYEFPEGSSCWHSGRGDSRYEGAVTRGVFHGVGVLASPDGKRWRGSWRHGQLHGDDCECIYDPLALGHLLENEKLPTEERKRRAVNTSGLYRMVRYQGSFDSHVRHGRRGSLLYENGDLVMGRFERGFAVGIVLYRFSTGRTRYAEHDESGSRIRWLSEDEDKRLREEALAEEAAKETEAQHRQHFLQALIL
ncbi:hypothetical protein P43SY_004782 [Pythium insidiosum]|uniref:Uncharacterized protein n=1 Tax=Pythium insidiosum TaxID=114742 RepID=A0AAD5M9A7_PYTIN|nr:hypothetical protein P43SY_004782 [Pythium insidiosum]